MTESGQIWCPRVNEQMCMPGDGHMGDSAPLAYPAQREGVRELLLSVGEQLGPMGAGGEGDRAVALGGAREDHGAQSRSGRGQC